MAPSLAILSLPVYYALLLYPSAVALRLVLRADRKIYDNANPRSPDTVAAYRKALAPRDFRTWERAKAANLQGYEVFPLVAATILIGLHVGVPTPRLDAAGGLLVLLRAAYNELYIRAERRRATYFRSATYFAQLGVCFALLTSAAFRYGDGDQ